MPAIRIVPLQTDEQFGRYAAFAEEVYRGNPHWVPRRQEQVVGLIGGRAPRCQDCRVQAFWAEQQNEIVATVTAVIDSGYNRHWNERLGHFVSFEALPGHRAAVERLLRTAGEWLRGHDCDAVRSAYLGGWQLPLTIDAYDEIPSANHGYNPPYYHAYFKNAGFETEKGMAQYQVRFTRQLARRYRDLVNQAERRGIRLRCWDFDRLDQEIVLFGELFNQTFAGHWGVGRVPEAHFAGLAAARHELIPEFMVFAEVDGQPAGVVSSPPDINQALHEARRQCVDPHPPAFRKLFDKIDHGILLVIGVKKQFRGRDIGLAMAAKSYLGMIEKGYKIASYTPVLDDNWPSRRTAEKLGCQVTRNFVIYRKALR